MINIEKFVNVLKNAELGPLMGVPCSLFKDIINYTLDHQSFEHYACSSEGESLGLAGGFALGGKYPIVYMQNDGYGNAVNPLSSLQLLYDLPALLMITWRGEPGKKDAPQHSLMGETLLQQLDIFKIPYTVLDEENFEVSIANATNYMKKEHKPYALIIKKGLFETYEAAKVPDSNLYIRMDYLRVLDEYLNEDDVVLGATGFSGREVYQGMAHQLKFYMMGSMGCLSSLGLGIAKSYPGKRIFVLDGDGALLMKMGSLSTVGEYQPDNLIHICFDNQAYESTGNQKTNAGSCDFQKVASACNYPTSFSIDTLEEFKLLIKNIDDLPKPLFLHIRIKSGTIKDLGRPSVTAVEMKKTFMDKL
jgi:phosphonopyruvate decarboxylase